jgi:DNA polymerase
MIYFDLETRSEVDLLKVGSWVYSQHPSTEVMCMAHKEDDKPTELWVPEGRWVLDLNWLSEARRMAHNAWFESCMWTNCLVPKYGFPEVPSNLWYCSSAWAAQFAIPKSLEGAGQALGLDVQKDKQGHTLMLKMCKPTKAWMDGDKDAPKWHEDPKDLERLYQYCIQDVDTEYELAQRLGAMSKRLGDTTFGGLE